MAWLGISKVTYITSVVEETNQSGSSLSAVKATKGFPHQTCQTMSDQILISAERYCHARTHFDILSACCCWLCQCYTNFSKYATEVYGLIPLSKFSRDTCAYGYGLSEESALYDPTMHEASPLSYANVANMIAQDGSRNLFYYIIKCIIQMHSHKQEISKCIQALNGYQVFHA